MSTAKVIQGGEVTPIVEKAMEATGGLLRLTPTWVPRSFLHPGRRLKLHPDDLYAYGAERGGIAERWFSSTTEAANDGRVWHEAATTGVEIENTGSEPRVSLRYIGPDAHTSVPNVGNYN